MYINFECLKPQILITLCTQWADLSAQGVAFANSLDPDQAQQIVGLDQRSKLFKNMILTLLKMRKKNHDIVLQLINV